MDSAGIWRKTWRIRLRRSFLAVWTAVVMAEKVSDQRVYRGTDKGSAWTEDSRNKAWRIFRPILVFKTSWRFFHFAREPVSLETLCSPRPC